MSESEDDYQELTIYMTYANYPEGRMGYEFYATEEEARDAIKNDSWSDREELYIPLSVIEKAMRIRRGSLE